MPLVFATLPYSGTRFTLDLIRPVVGVPHKTAEDGGTFYHHHCRDSIMPRYEELWNRGFQFMTVYRPINDIIASWHRRFPNETERLDIFYNEHFPNWLTIVKISDFIFDLRVEHREQSLANLNTFLSADLTTDWTPIGHYE